MLRNVLIYLIIFNGSFIFSNPIDEIAFKHSENLYNFYIEISGGTKEKWEINKKNWSIRKGPKKWQR